MNINININMNEDVCIYIYICTHPNVNTRGAAATRENCSSSTWQACAQVFRSGGSGKASGMSGNH